MILIAHRGNTSGPNPSEENKPETITKCILEGYNVEIDIRLIDDVLYLGHDTPDYRVEVDFLLKNKDYLWIHCKDLESLTYLTGLGLTTFYHDKDDYILTSKGIIWAYPGKKVNEKCVNVMPELTGLTNIDTLCFGICSDYIKYIKNIF